MLNIGHKGVTEQVYQLQAHSGGSINLNDH